MISNHITKKITEKGHEQKNPFVFMIKDWLSVINRLLDYCICSLTILVPCLFVLFG